MDVDGEIEDNDTGTRMSLRQRPPRKASDAFNDDSSSKFLEDFDPERSNREKRKLRKKVSQKLAPYDEYGNIRQNGKDLCDCMKDECPGCWFECRNCGSRKCGPQCRVNRKFFYESITFDGKDLTVNNKYFSNK